MSIQGYGIKKKPTTVRNPQANAIVKQTHQVLTNMIWTFKPDTDYLPVDNPWKGVLSETAFAMRSTYHTMLKKTLGQLVFGRDMFFNIQHVESWELICQDK